MGASIEGENCDVLGMKWKYFISLMKSLNFTNLLTASCILTSLCTLEGRIPPGKTVVSSKIPGT